ncbi:ankyrin repeat-containing domain protein [Chytridium lagenaria]|nr:ankyrin repeat-containing domain protein [Chytridium lagenaria]
MRWRQASTFHCRRRTIYPFGRPPLEVIRGVASFLTPHDVPKLKHLSHKSHRNFCFDDFSFARTNLIRFFGIDGLRNPLELDRLDWNLLRIPYWAALFASVLGDACAAFTQSFTLDVCADGYAALRWTFLVDDVDTFSILFTDLSIGNDDLLDLCLCACRFGASSILPLLLERIHQTPNLNFIPTGTTCLTESATRGHALSVSLLMSASILPTSHLLVMAARRGHVDVVDLLLTSRNVDPSAFDSKALRVAAAHGQDRVVKRLLETGRVDPGSADNVALRRASEYGFKEVVRMVLDTGMADPAAEDNYAIRWAAVNGHLEVVKMLIASPGVNPAACDNLPLICAAQSGHRAVVKLLIDTNRVNPAACRGQALIRAASNGHLPVVLDLLATKKFRLRTCGARALIGAARNGHLDIVNVLLGYGRCVDPGAQNNLAVREAAHHGHVKVVERLLETRRVNPADEDNMAIQWAAANGHVETVKVLLQVEMKRQEEKGARCIAAFKPLQNFCGIIRTKTKVPTEPTIPEPSLLDQPHPQIPFHLLPLRDPASRRKIPPNPTTTLLRRLLPSPRRIDPSADTHFAIRAASLNGHIDVVRVLLSTPLVDADAAAQHALVTACAAGQEKVVKVLLDEFKAMPTVAALCGAADAGAVGIVKRVLESGRVDLEALGEVVAGRGGVDGGMGRVGGGASGEAWGEVIRAMGEAV